MSLNEIQQLTSLLSPNRACDYRSWIEVGFCLFDLNSQLLDSWTRFSHHNPQYEEGSCEKIWNQLKKRDDPTEHADRDNLCRLHWWAKSDNLKKYFLLGYPLLTQLILKSQSRQPADVADVAYHMYQYEYRWCPEKNIMYEYRCGQWIISTCDCVLKKFGNEMLNEYLRLITYYNLAAYEQGDDQKDEYLEVAGKLTNVTYSLRDYEYKLQILDEYKLKSGGTPP